MRDRQIEESDGSVRQGERPRRDVSDSEQRGERSRRGRGHGEQQGKRGHGAQTFRRGRILVFLEQMQNRRTTLARQLGQEEYEHICPIISGELKAIDQVIDEYVHLFELQNEDVIPNKNLESESE
ncbi:MULTISPECIES: hypothetical protein [unclassified Paenibacillus]|uniref:hypothetical protein n=1 Tax=unclassified Paenibacillus TaxID=185978 RepID=UPI000CFB355A|nr:MULTISPECIES: hypothetical protein [unclassified Paenibacillus]PRA07322.1 hypothetical protein CQ043_07945 [Paenibacillus sp. MYb63]PRA50966.1 hypothetical protein CQ061_01100 [Paenibacillus sp. MYb67]